MGDWKMTRVAEEEFVVRLVRGRGIELGLRGL